MQKCYALDWILYKANLDPELQKSEAYRKLISDMEIVS